jgi:hypothetical protein
MNNPSGMDITASGDGHPNTERAHPHQVREQLRLQCLVQRILLRAFAELNYAV